MRSPASLMLIALFALSGKSQQLSYYFGNIHSHTGFSDGNKDSSISGISRPDGSYSYARLSNDFDFLGISEHNHYSTKGNPGFRRPLYQQGLAMAVAATEEGVFLALYGMEYGVSSQYNGHVIIYGSDELLGWEESAPGVNGPNYDVFNAKTDYPGLFAKVKARPGAFCYLAHPSFDDFSADGTWATSLANAPYNASFDSVIVGMPLRSGLATNNGATYSNYPQGHYFNYYKKMLYNGYHLGIGYDHDNHYSNFGRGNGGRLVIMATSLNRAGFYEAMRARRFYGSDDSNARITFKCNGSLMGTVTAGNHFPALEVVHDDPDGELADTIKIWKGTAGSGGLWAEIVHGALENNTTIFTDSLAQPGKEHYYFAEIRQKDGQWIVTSPVWYTLGGTTGVVAGEGFNSSIFYDAFRRCLNLSVDKRNAYSLRILSLHGSELFRQSFSESSLVTDISLLPAGLYLVSISDGVTEAIRKIVVY